MALRQYVAAFRKGWWIILIGIVLGVSAALFVNVRVTPQYASNVTFFISTPSGDGTSALAADQFATRRITSYVGLLSSDVVAQQVIEKMGIDLTVDEVSSSITGVADLNTVLLTATVTDSSPDRSLAIAQGLSSEFGNVVDQVDPIGPGQVVLRVISGPTLDPVPISPRKTFNLAIGFLVGLALGAVVALLRQVLDNSVRQPQQLRALTQAPVLGVIPFEKDAKSSPLIVDSHARSIRAEAFRHLRTSLQFIDIERPVRVLVVTSSIADEGKSTTATNLAVSFSDSGRRVLLIEADLRRPKVSHYMGLEGAIGLTNVLAGQVSIDDALQPWGRGGLTVLPSGSIPPNPSELLGSPTMVELLDSLKAGFDTIVIDTPPLLPVTDAAVMAVHSDGAVLVVRYGKTTQAQVTTAIRSLTAVDARILGSILTMSPIKGAEGYESYGSQYYGEVAPPEETIDAGGAQAALGEPSHGVTESADGTGAEPGQSAGSSSSNGAPDGAARARRAHRLLPRQ